MARKKTPAVRVTVKAELSGRLRTVRQELFGEHGGPELARRLNLPARTWYNYETGVTVPAEVLLSFIDQTDTNPVWLLSGKGPRYRSSWEGAGLENMTAQQLIRRGLEKLEESGVEGASERGVTDYLSLEIVPLSQVCKARGPGATPEGEVLADRKWIPHPSETVAARLEDDSMNPILPRGSVVAIDRAIRDPEFLSGRLVAACTRGHAMVRWLDVSGRHLILRPNQPSREHPLVPIDLDESGADVILGQIVWSWSHFGD